MKKFIRRTFSKYIYLKKDVEDDDAMPNGKAMCDFSGTRFTLASYCQFYAWI